MEAEERKSSRWVAGAPTAALLIIGLSVEHIFNLPTWIAVGVGLLAAFVVAFGLRRYRGGNGRGRARGEDSGDPADRGKDRGGG